MKKLKKYEQYIEGKLSEEELDAFTKDVVKEHFEKEELQQRWRDKLEKEHHLSLDEPPVIKKKNALQKRLRLLALVAASVLLLLSFWLAADWMTSPVHEKLIKLELDQPYVEALSRKGSDEELQLQAVAAYNNRDYTSAIAYFERLAQNSQSIDWDFYIGLCHLYQHRPQMAIQSLIPILKYPSGKYTTETHWYLGLAYAQNKEFELAKKYLTLVAYRSNDEMAWKVKEARALLEALAEQE